MFSISMEHGGIRPSGHALLRKHRGNRLTFAFKAVSLIRPGAGRDHAFVFKVAHLHRGIVPVAVNQGMLIAQNLKHGLILFFSELVRIANPQLRLRRFDKQRRIGNVNRAIISLHAPLIRLAIR